VVVGGTTPVNTNAATGNLTINGSGNSILNYTVGGAAKGWIYHDATNFEIYNNIAGAIKLFTSATERMRITSVGAIQVKSTTGATPTYSYTNDGECLEFRYNDDSGVRAADIVAIGNTPAGAAMNMRFWTNQGTGAGTATEKMRVASDGSVRIAMQNFGATPSSTNYGVSINNTGAGSRFFGQGSGTETQIEFGNTNGTRGSIQTNSTNTLYNTTSDYRLKEDVIPMVGALNTVSALKPCTYTWKVDGSAGQGFIAHELAEVVPDCVSGEKDAVDEDNNIKPQCIDTSFLVATLTAAIQELKAINDTQIETINALTARIVALETQGA
jgi:hypothetical protein